MKDKTTEMFNEVELAFSPAENYRNVGKMRTINAIQDHIDRELEKLRPCLRLIDKNQYVGAP